MSYIEVICAIVVLTIGIVAQISALTFGVIRVRENELRTGARHVATSAIESIFSAREIKNSNGIDSWKKVNPITVSSGIFSNGWNFVREDPGADGIIGTADDACGYALTCNVNGYVNRSTIDVDFERKIEISEVVESGATVANKKRITVTVRYWIGNIPRELQMSTLIADLPITQ